jgi:hypothetical protein
MSKWTTKRGSTTFRSSPTAPSCQKARRGAGSPARLAAIGVPLARANRPGREYAIFFGSIHLGLIYAMGYLLRRSLAPAAALIGYALYLRGPMAGVAVAFAAVPVALALHLAGSLLIRNATKLLRY